MNDLQTQAAAAPAPGGVPAIEDGVPAIDDGTNEWFLDAFDVDPRTYDGATASSSASASPSATAEPASGGFFDKLSDAAGAITDRLAAVAETIGKGVADAANAIYEEGVTLIKGPPPPPPPEMPKARVDKAMKALPDADQATVQALLDGAGSEGERRYLSKALVAGHSAAEISDFEKKIKGKDDRWLNDHLRLVGDSNGKGIMQQWSDSCAPTSVEAIKGELDPIYAMKMREENPNFESADDAKGDTRNPGMAADQKQMLVAGGGVAASRDDPGGKGKGMVYSQLLNAQSATTGLTFATKVIGTDTTVDDALNAMAAGVKDGLPVPITVGDAASPFAHAAVVTAVDPGPPRSFTIHDPYYGKTESFTEDQIKNDQVNVGGWHHVGVVFPPKLKD